MRADNTVIARPPPVHGVCMHDLLNLVWPQLDAASKALQLLWVYTTTGMSLRTDVTAQTAEWQGRDPGNRGGFVDRQTLATWCMTDP